MCHRDQTDRSRTADRRTIWSIIVQCPGVRSSERRRHGPGRHRPDCGATSSRNWTSGTYMKRPAPTPCLNCESPQRLPHVVHRSRVKKDRAAHLPNRQRRVERKPQLGGTVHPAVTDELPHLPPTECRPTTQHRLLVRRQRGVSPLKVSAEHQHRLTDQPCVGLCPIGGSTNEMVCAARLQPLVAGDKQHGIPGKGRV